MESKRHLLLPTPKPPPDASPVTASSDQPQVIVLNTGLQAQGNVPGGNMAAAENQRFQVMAGRITGWMQIVCAILSTICGIISILVALCVMGEDQCRPYNDEHDNFDFTVYVAWPIWGGLCFYLVAGILGVSTGRKNTSVIVAYKVMSIFAATSSVGQVIMESFGAAISSYYCSDTDGDYECHYQILPMVMHCLAAVIALVEMVVAIVAAAYCCHGVCCRIAPQQIILQVTTTPAPQYQRMTPSSAPPQYHDVVN